MLRTKLKAIAIGALAAQALLNTKPDIVGEVVATFPNSFYMKTTNHELVFVTNRQLKSPITINLEPKSDLTRVARPLVEVSLQNDQIRVGELACIDLSEALQCSHNPADHAHRYRLTSSQDILYLGPLVLGIVDNDLSVLDPDCLAHAAISEFASDGVIPLRHSDDVEDFFNAGGKIVGLGGGFTPSGDDLLGGFLATYNAFTQEIGRQPIIFGMDFLKSKTSWISAKLLDYMQRRVLDDQVSGLIGSAASGDKDKFLLALETLLPRGHTSGIDIAAGVMLALGLLMDIIAGGDEAELIVKRLGLVP